MKEKLRKILLVVCVCVFAYSAFQLGKIYFDYHQIEEENKELIQEVIEEPKEDNDPLHRVIDFTTLLETNEDIVGWIYIPDTKIDEPIVKGEDNDSYLKTSIYGKYSSAGTIFIDEINHGDFQDDNTIIYGHNMKNGSRFHDLRYYFQKENYIETHPNVYIYLPNGKINVYHIYSASQIKATSDLYQKGIDYEQYIQKVLKSATVKTTVSDEEAPLIMLSTCTNNVEDERYVIFARLQNNE